MLNIKRLPNVVTPEERPTRLMLSRGMLQHQAQRCQPPPATSVGSKWYRSVWFCQGVLNRNIKKQKLPNLDTEIQLQVCTHEYAIYIQQRERIG